MEVLFLLAMVGVIWWGLGRGGGSSASVTAKAEVGRVHVPGIGYLTVEELQKLCSGRGKLSEAKLWRPPGEQRNRRRIDESMSDYDMWSDMHTNPIYSHLPSNVYYDPDDDNFDSGSNNDDYSSIDDD